MKKTTAWLLIILLLAALSVPVSAITVSDPTIEYTAPDAWLSSGDPACVYVQASRAEPEDTIHYIWYHSTSPDMSTIIAEPSAPDSSTYYPPERPGTHYYCCGVYCTRDGMYSGYIYSRMIAVTYEEPESTLDISVITPPDRTSYKVGDYLDPTGLQVRVFTTLGFFDLLDGVGVACSPLQFTDPGPHAITVTYIDEFGTFTTSFDVNVTAHTHSFGEWMTTTEPTCTEEGIKARECDCGHTERGSIAMLEHEWDDGEETEKPTAKEDGEMTFTCKHCGETKTEPIPATGGGKKPVSGKLEEKEEETEEESKKAVTGTKSEAEEAPAEEEQAEKDPAKTEAEPKDEDEKEDKSDGARDKGGISPLLIVIPAAVAALCIGGAIFLLMRHKKKQ